MRDEQHARTSVLQVLSYDTQFYNQSESIPKIIGLT